MPTATTKPKNRFEMLNCINCGEHIEKKNGLSYLSWAWAWTEFKKIFPDSFYTIYENPEGLNYFTDGKTCWVKTGVTLVDGAFQLEHIEMLPVMDFKNKSVPLAGVDSMAVNKTIQRSLTKAIARHGLGCYIYAGEDLPEESEETKAAKEAEQKAVASLIADIDSLAKQLTGSYTTAQKTEFFQKYVTPAIGQMNYKLCTDRAKLSALRDTLSQFTQTATKQSA